MEGCIAAECPCHLDKMVLIAVVDLDHLPASDDDLDMWIVKCFLTNSVMCIGYSSVEAVKLGEGSHFLGPP